MSRVAENVERPEAWVVRPLTYASAIAPSNLCPTDDDFMGARHLGAVDSGYV